MSLLRLPHLAAELAYHISARAHVQSCFGGALKAISGMHLSNRSATVVGVRSAPIANAVWIAVLQKSLLHHVADCV